MPTDKQRLDYLQALTDLADYSGRVICRWSSTGRGWRLHETSQRDATESVREAIDKMMKENPLKNQKENKLAIDL